jgi:hypothetical protein
MRLEGHFEGFAHSTRSAPQPTLGAVCLEPKHRPIPIVVRTHAPRCGLAPLASPHADFLIARATCGTDTSPSP